MTLQVLLTGTDPQEPRGGIGVAMAGYRTALDAVDMDTRLIPSYRPDVLGGRWWWAVRAGGRLIGAIRAQQRSGGTSVVYAHGGRGIGLARQSLLLYVARANGAHTMLQLHSMSVDRYLRSRLGRTFLRLCLSPADRTCVLSEWWRTRLRALDEDLETTVIPNPLPPDLERIAREGSGTRRWDRRAGLRLLTMTRLVPGKGVDLAIRTVARLPTSFRLRIAGEGRERLRYERLAEELGLGERVRFVGWAKEEEKHELFGEGDIFFLPTRYDSFGMAFLEAMAFGLPVVAVRWGPIEHVVPHERAGFLVERAEPDALAEAVLRLRDPTLRERMGAFGRSWVLEQFGARTVGETIRRAAANLVDQPPARNDRGRNVVEG